MKEVKEIKSQTLRTIIRNLSHEGRGVSTFNQKTVFIDNALPGEELIFEYQRKHRRFDEAKAIEILTPSMDRVEPLCPHFTMCGGCSLQHMETNAQIKAKEQFLLEHLQHFGKITPETIFAPIQGPVWGYRQKARLGVRYVKKKEKLLVGFHEKNSNKVAEISFCEILDPKVATLIEPLKVLIANLTVYQLIPQIEVAVGNEGVALVFRVMQSPVGEDIEKLIEFAKEHAILLYLQESGPESLKLLWPATSNSTSSLKNSDSLIHYSLEEQNLKFAFSPLDFTQVNQTMNQKMVNRVMELLNPTSEDSILDLFCGLGNFTLPMAQKAKKVVGIEGNEKMVERASKNALLNNIANVEFYSANLEEDLNISLAEFNKILLDPPRSGALQIIQKLIHSKKELKKLERIVYVSCNPASFARDLGLLVNEGGYTLKGVQVLDMFPQTTHVESIAILER